MNYKTTLVLIVLLAVLGGFVYVMRDKAPSYQEIQASRQDQTQGRPVFTTDALQATQVDGVIITHQGQTARLAKTGNDWRQVEPVDFPLVQWQVEDLVNLVAGLKAIDQFTPGQGDYPTADKLGLEPAVTRITLQQEGKPEQAVIVGRPIVGGQAYVKVQGREGVYVVDGQITRQLGDKPVHRLRQKTLIAPPVQQADKLIYASASLTNWPYHHPAPQQVEITRQGDHWTLSPTAKPVRANPETVRTFINDIAAVTAQQFVADAPQSLAIYGLDKPVVMLTLISTPPATSPDAPAQPRTHTLRIGGPADLQNTHYYATWTRDDAPPVVFTITAASKARFEKDDQALVDPRLLVAKAADIRSVELDHADAVAVAFTRGQDGWAFTPSQEDRPGVNHAVDYQADDAVVAGLVQALAEARATNVQAMAERADLPRVVVKLGITGLAEPVELQFRPASQEGQDDQPQWLVAPRGQGVFYLVPGKALAPVTWKPWQFRQRELVSLDAGRVGRITIQQADGYQVKLERTLPTPPGVASVSVGDDRHGPWQQAGVPLGDESMVNAILAGVSPLHATAWRSPQDKLDGPVHTLEVTTDQGQSLKLHVDGRGVAMLDGGDQAFEITPALRDAIMGEFRDRTIIGLGHGQVGQVRREMAGQAVTLIQTDAGGFASADASVKVDTDRAAVLVDALLGLRVQRWSAAPETDAGTLTLAATFTVQAKEPGRPAVTVTLYQPVPADADHLRGQVDGRWFIVPSQPLPKLLADLSPPTTK